MASIINSGISALNAFKRQLETTGHNIANVNTPGYSRQNVQFATREAQPVARDFIGSGVDVASVRRSYDENLAIRVREYTSSREEFSVYEQRAKQIDNVIADASAGIDGMLQQLFAAVNDVASDPTSIEARSMVLSRATQLSDRFNSLDSWFSDIRNRLNQDLQREVDEINSLAKSLTEVNARIGSLNGEAFGTPNDMLDERDLLVDKLSNYTSVSTVVQGDGSVNVFVGTGQALVVGAARNNLAVAQNALAQDSAELVVQQAGLPPVNVTRQMTGGSLGGLLRFRDEILDEAHNALGRVAIGVAHFFNDQHRTGMDLQGELGVDFFALPSGPQVLGNGTPNITAAYSDISALSTHDYQLDYLGGNWSVTNLNTGVSTALAGGGPFTIDGMTITVTSVPTGDESYRIHPTRQGANAIGLLINDERDVAAADPIVSGAKASNTGTGAISVDGLASRTGNTRLATPMTLQFNSATNQFDVFSGDPPVGAAIATVNYDPSADSGNALSVSIAGLGNYDFTMTGTPANGDRWTLADNAAGNGDNRNARVLADLQKANLMLGGTATFANTYGALVSDVGTRTQQAANNASIQADLLSQAKSAKAEVSGVNLDEEAANLVRFQQAYQAAAQVISVANSLFDSLLGAVRR